MNDLLALIGVKYTSPSTKKRERRPNEVEILTKAAKVNAKAQAVRAQIANRLALKRLGRSATSNEVAKIRGLKGSVGVHNQLKADDMLTSEWRRAESGQHGWHFWFKEIVKLT